jgi:hypothetical protein
MNDREYAVPCEICGRTLVTTCPSWGTRRSRYRRHIVEVHGGILTDREVTEMADRMVNVEKLV